MVFFPTFFPQKNGLGCRDAVEPRARGDHLRRLGPLRRGLAGTEARKRKELGIFTGYGHSYPLVMTKTIGKPQENHRNPRKTIGKPWIITAIVFFFVFLCSYSYLS